MRRIAEAATGGLAGGAAVTAPIPEVLGPYLTTNHIGLISYAEVIQIAGFLWIVCLSLKAIIKGVIWLKDWRKNKEVDYLD